MCDDGHSNDGWRIIWHYMSFSFSQPQKESILRPKRLSLTDPQSVGWKPRFERIFLLFSSSDPLTRKHVLLSSHFILERRVSHRMSPESLAGIFITRSLCVSCPTITAFPVVT